MVTLRDVRIWLGDLVWLGRAHLAHLIDPRRTPVPFRRGVVAALELGCRITHPITTRRPWLWFFDNCPLASLAFRLDEKWGTDPTVPAPEETHP